MPKKNITLFDIPAKTPISASRITFDLRYVTDRLAGQIIYPLKM